VIARTVIDEPDVRAKVDGLTSQGVSRTEAVKRVARELGLPRNAVYEIAHRQG